MTHDHTHQHRHRRERRARKIEDKQLTAMVAAIGGGSDDDWDQDGEWTETTDQQGHDQ